MSIVPVYAALLAILFVGLSVRTLRLRRRLQIAVGDGGDATMLRAMRAHANFAEYVPIGLIMLFFVEAMGVRPPFVHGLCGMLLVGRAVHAYGVSRVDEDFRFRVAGMVMTFAAVIGAALTIIGVQLVRPGG
ncbi:MAG: MAPEG family protein [Alphaproteobacteria bacterium]|nr:MAPEG family protein [Alphaproteobacteria bacterium]